MTVFDHVLYCMHRQYHISRDNQMTLFGLEGLVILGIYSMLGVDFDRTPPLLPIAVYRGKDLHCHENPAAANSLSTTYGIEVYRR
jgi:hypothetical protein